MGRQLPLRASKRCWQPLTAPRPRPPSPHPSKQVKELLPGGRASIPALGEVLRSAASCMESEMEAPAAAGADTADGPSSSGGSGDEADGSGAAGPTGGAAGAGAGDASKAAAPAGESAAAAAAGSSSGGDGGGGGALEGLRPHTRFAAGQLPLLRDVLGLEPPPVLVQFSKAPQPALGTHRLWAADVLAVLLLAGHPGIDAAVADSGALPAVVALALKLDKCSLLHFRALQMVDCCLRSREARLWRGLFEPGMGAGVTSAAAGGDGGDAPCAPLHEALAQIGGRPREARGIQGAERARRRTDLGACSCPSAATVTAPSPTPTCPLPTPRAAEASIGKPMGERPGRAGLAARLAAVLLSATGTLAEVLPPPPAPPGSGDEDDAKSSASGGSGEAGGGGGGGGGGAANGGGKPSSNAPSKVASEAAAPPRNDALAAALASGPAWAAAAVPGGALVSLLAEQQGDLCGPRPQRLEAMSDDGGEVGDALGGGSVLSGEQLLAMLQDMSSFSTQE
jgi:hypothetical protein